MSMQIKGVVCTSSRLSFIRLINYVILRNVLNRILKHASCINETDIGVKRHWDKLKFLTNRDSYQVSLMRGLATNNCDICSACCRLNDLTASVCLRTTPLNFAR